MELIRRWIDVEPDLHSEILRPAPRFPEVSSAIRFEAERLQLSRGVRCPIRRRLQLLLGSQFISICDRSQESLRDHEPLPARKEHADHRARAEWPPRSQEDDLRRDDGHDQD